MGIVGPRPHLPKHDGEFSQITRSYHGRAFVKRGITGPAHVQGYRGEITAPHKLHRRVYWDIYYVARWSIWLDLRIILTTAWHVASPPRSAYGRAVFYLTARVSESETVIRYMLAGELAWVMRRRSFSAAIFWSKRRILAAPISRPV